MSCKTETIIQKSIHALLLVALTFVCLAGQTAHAAGTDETGTLQYEGATLPISIGKIEKNDKGNTTVEILTDFKVSTGVQGDLASADDFSRVMDSVSAARSKAIKVKIVAGGKTVKVLPSVDVAIGVGGSASGFVITVSRATYTVDTSANPEKIIVYNDHGSIAFDGRTKKLIKRGVAGQIPGRK